MNIRVSDVKQYFYCPRVVYHTYFTPVHRPTTHPMELGADEHEVLSVLERRRTLARYGLEAGSRKFHVPLRAEALGLTGVLDLLIETETGAFPVEFKSTRGRLDLNAKCQLTAYAMMVEGVSRRHGDSRVYLSDSHGANHAGSNFSVAPRENARRTPGHPANVVGRVDASTDAAAREVRRMRISAILRRCVVK